MTTIILVTNDQSLSVLLKPLVASGDYNLVRVKVEFDSAWERYPVRSAVFRTLKGAEAEVLLADDECVVPHEVLAEAGTLFIAMRGVTLDGKIIKTTEEVKYKIVQGAKDIASTTAPSHDMFAQYMAAIAAGIAPHIQDMENKVDAELAEMNTKADATLDEIEADAGEAIAKYEAIAGSYIRMKAGSYVGTGTSGASNPNTVPLDFAPRYAIVFSDGYCIGKDVWDVAVSFMYGGTNCLKLGTFYLNDGTSVAKDLYEHLNFTMKENALSWHSGFVNPYTDTNHMWYIENQKRAARHQMNEEGKTYFYIIFGV